VADPTPPGVAARPGRPSPSSSWCCSWCETGSIMTMGMSCLVNRWLGVRVPSSAPYLKALNEPLRRNWPQPGQGEASGCSPECRGLVRLLARW